MDKEQQIGLGIFQELVSEASSILYRHKISTTMGILADNPPRNLPVYTGDYWRDKFIAQIEHIIGGLTQFSQNKHIAKLVQELPTEDWEVNDLDENLVFPLMFKTSMVMHAYFREVLPYNNQAELVADKSIKYLPGKLAKPMWKFSKKTGIRPTMAYNLYSPWNYYLKNVEVGFKLDNIELIHSFTGSKDESWFVRIHQGMEHKAAPIYYLLLMSNLLARELIKEKRQGVYSFLSDRLCGEMNSAVAHGKEVVEILERMREGCNYKTYFKMVRMYYGVPINIVYEGVEELKDMPQTYLGETGGQTPLMQFWNFALGLNLDTIEYFKQMREHMRYEHRAFLEFMKKSYLRKFVLNSLKDNHAQPTKYYNHMLMNIIDWRREHLTDVRDYIGNLGDSHGTGHPALTWLNKLYKRSCRYIINKDITL